MVAAAVNNNDDAGIGPKRSEARSMPGIHEDRETSFGYLQRLKRMVCSSIDGLTLAAEHDRTNFSEYRGTNRLCRECQCIQLAADLWLESRCRNGHTTAPYDEPQLVIEHDHWEGVGGEGRGEKQRGGKKGCSTSGSSVALSARLSWSKPNLNPNFLPRPYLHSPSELPSRQESRH